MTLDIRNPTHARLLARQAVATPPPTSWLAQPSLTWDQFSALAAERARLLNAVVTTQHIRQERRDV